MTNIVPKGLASRGAVATLIIIAIAISLFQSVGTSTMQPALIAADMGASNSQVGLVASISLADAMSRIIAGFLAAGILLVGLMAFSFIFTRGPGASFLTVVARFVGDLLRVIFREIQVFVGRNVFTLTIVLGLFMAFFVPQVTFLIPAMAGLLPVIKGAVQTGPGAVAMMGVAFLILLHLIGRVSSRVR